MALVYNASAKDQSVKVFGKWQSIKSGQVKQFNDDVSHFLITERKGLGLVGLPSDFEDVEFRSSEKGKEILTKKKIEGVTNRIARLEMLRKNETTSLQQDLDQAGIKVNSRAYASDTLLEALEELAGYKHSAAQDEEERIKKIEELEKKLGV